MKNLTIEEIRIEIAQRNLFDWTIGETSIEKTFLFKDFRQAMAFMNTCGEIAEQMNHHPDWRNIYNQVEVILSTHETGGITINDLELAQAMNRLI
ncbi:MAG: 4a-hydroxytetrahydrobiopterin dehydratase [Bacteroidia bacterium]|nr:4a-hydroxytetrahydrobiopterin dehydratase [Bacteroidia bacterium]